MGVEKALQQGRHQIGPVGVDHPEKLPGRFISPNPMAKVHHVAGRGNDGIGSRQCRRRPGLGVDYLKSFCFSQFRQFATWKVDNGDGYSLSGHMGGYPGQKELGAA